MSITDAVTTYAQEVQRQFGTGHAAEHAYRPALQRLMEELGEIDAVNDPRRSEHGAPDFVFLKRGSKTLILGWAEAKDVDGNLDKTEKTEQLRRYSAYSNLYLTNYLEFRFYSSGTKYDEVSIGSLDNGTITLNPENYEMLANLLTGFIGQKPQPITSGVKLAQVMGAMAWRIHTAVGFYLKSDSEHNDELLAIFNLIKETLVHDLDQERFADMYAQTLVYGLFAARYNDPTPDTFSRAEARDLVPPSNPFLRQFFDHIAGANFDWRLARIVDELCEIFAVSAVRDIVHKHLVTPQLDGMGADDRDPIIHFYEDFLKAYDPEQRKRMGAYYTPLPVVRFMIRMVDKILKEEFGLPKGIADTSKSKVKVNVQGKKVEQEFHTVQILDPAVGTATFLNEIIKYIHQGFAGQEGRWPAYAKDELIPRLHGFELMMAPYTVAHLKLGLTLKESGVDDFGKRLGVYLTNTLEEGMDMPQTLFQQPGLAGAVAAEAIEAGAIKNERPIMVVIGNPPYSGESSNRTEFAGSLIEHYKVEPGGMSKLHERNPKWINDDYVKFIAFAEHMIKRNGSGIVAMITNHAYLDNPTFRGMRWQLLRSFDSIYIYDLHGNSKKKETAPEGVKDKNVFDIQQGVAILVGVLKQKNHKQLANASFCEAWGARAAKFGMLAQDAEWEELQPSEPEFFLLRKNEKYRDEFRLGVPVNELFELSNVGIVTGADKTLVGSSRAEVLKQVQAAIDGAATGKISDRIVGHVLDPALVASFTYRPFDDRFLYLANDLVERPRDAVMSQMRNPNVAMTVGRQGQVVGMMQWSLVSVVNKPVEFNYFYRGGEQVLPLFVHAEGGGRVSNLNAAHVAKLTATLESHRTPHEIFDYVYGTLHSAAYREKYGEFLKTDFPRVPIPDDDAAFDHFAKHGNRLRQLHLLDSSESHELVTTFPNTGSGEVDKPEFAGGKVHINENQYFGNVPEVAWNFYVGGYQPAQKWLKDRKGRILSGEDIEHYQRIITVLTRTDEIMKAIDDR